MNRNYTNHYIQRIKGFILKYKNKTKARHTSITKDINVIKFHGEFTIIGRYNTAPPYDGYYSAPVCVTSSASGFFKIRRSQARYSLAPCQAQTCAWLRREDSNLQPSPYSLPHISMGRGTISYPYPCGFRTQVHSF